MGDMTTMAKEKVQETPYIPDPLVEKVYRDCPDDGLIKVRTKEDEHHLYQMMAKDGRRVSVVVKPELHAAALWRRPYKRKMNS